MRNSTKHHKHIWLVPWDTVSAAAVKHNAEGVMLFSATGFRIGRQHDRGWIEPKIEWSLKKTCTQPLSREKILHSVSEWPGAQSQDDTGMALGQIMSLSIPAKTTPHRHTVGKVKPFTTKLTSVRESARTNMRKHPGVQSWENHT